MSKDPNLCQFIGRLGKDPDMRYTAEGKAIANLTIACSESWKDKQGNKQEKPEWVRISAFGKLAEIMGQYLKKGAQVYISGRMQTRKWQDKDGHDRYTTEIVADQLQMLDSRSGASSSPPDAHSAPIPDDGFDDSIPF